MELRQLRYLVAVVDEGQFVRAAAALHLAQSALSEQIRVLERDVGAELLVRDRRGVTPTPAGEVLLGHARALLERADLARAEVARLTGLVSGTLRVGSGSPSGRVPLAETLVDFRRRHPAVDIVLRDATSDELVRWLQEGAVDVVVITFSPERLPDGIRGVLVAREPLLALVPHGHRLASHGTLSLPDLAGEPFITYPRGSGIRDTIEEGFRVAGVARPPIVAETIDPLTIVELVEAGLGVALVSTALAEFIRGGVRTVPLADPGLRGNETVAWRRERRSLPALEAFLELAGDWLPGAAGLR
jgi:DNA-binding transcriptional LysR family regulator